MNAELLKTLQSIARRYRTTLYLVGGPVRDQLLNRPCHDWDMVCVHAEAVARAAARMLKGGFVVLDEQYKIFRVAMNAATLDVAELQGGSIEKDLSRRDFTINAIAQVLGTTSLIDPMNGRRDLERKLLRAVSNKAFADDPLRLLRAFRFAAQFDLKIESKTRRWIREKPGRLSKIAPERIREECLRLFAQPNTALRLREMDHAGVLSILFPEVESCRRTAVGFYGHGGVLKHSFQTVENLEWLLAVVASPSFFEGRGRLSFSTLMNRRNGAMYPQGPTCEKLQRYLSSPLGGYPRRSWMKLAGFLHDIGKPATVQKIKGRLRFFGHEEVGAELAQKRLESLRCSRQESHDVSLWVRHHMRLGSLAASPQTTDKAIARYFRTLGDEGMGMLLISLADHYTYLAKAKWGKGKDSVERLMCRMMESYCTRREKMLPERLINGHQVMKALRLKPGPVVGELLEAIQDAQSEGTIRTKEEAIVCAKKLLGSHRRF